MKKVIIGLIGYGVVGQGIAQLLVKKRSEFRKIYDTDFQLKTICDRSINKKDTSKLKSVHCSSNFDDVLKDDEINVVVELIGGIQPAKSMIETALKSGKHVVTANKAVIASHGPSLFKLAQENNVHLYYESAVGAGVPMIKTLTDGIAGNSVNGIYGIINGTCNYILSEMTTNQLDFNKAVELAQAKGYAESDSTLDTNGMDAAHKLTILVSLGMRQKVDVKNVYTEGIEGVTQEDIVYAQELGFCIKLLAIAKQRKASIQARVHPTMISLTHPLAAVNDIYNALFLDCDPLGQIMLEGPGAGQMAAASGVLTDIINLATTGSQSVWSGNKVDDSNSCQVESIQDLSSKYYIRIMVLDKPGVLSDITGIFGANNISIASLNQKYQHKTSAVPIIILTHKAKELDIQNALKAIHKLKAVKQKPMLIRMENG